MFSVACGLLFLKRLLSLRISGFLNLFPIEVAPLGRPSFSVDPSSKNDGDGLLRRSR